QTSRSIKPRERDLGDLRLFFLARFFTRPTNHPRHAACASNFQSKPVRPHFCGDTNVMSYCDSSTATSNRIDASDSDHVVIVNLWAAEWLPVSTPTRRSISTFPILPAGFGSVSIFLRVQPRDGSAEG